MESSCDGKIFNDAEVLLCRLKIFTESKLDFVDALLCAYKLVRGDAICTFDKRLVSFLQNHPENKE